MSLLLAPIENTPRIGGNRPGFEAVDASGRQVLIKSNLSATSDPGASDDAGAGYLVGSRWTNTITGKVWEAVSVATLAAVWKDLTATTPPAGSGTEFQYRASATGFGAIAGSSWAGGVATLPTLAVSDLTSGRIPYSGTGGRVQNSTLTFAVGGEVDGNSATIGRATAPSQTIEFSPSYGGFLNGTWGVRGRLLVQNYGYLLVGSGDGSNGYSTLIYSHHTDVALKLQLASGQTADALQVTSFGGTAGDLFKVVKNGSYEDVYCSGYMKPSLGLETQSPNAYIGFNGRTIVQSPSNGVLLLENYAGTDFNRLQFGGTTASFPALKRNGIAIDVCYADDSGRTTLNAGTLLATNGLYLSTNNQGSMLWFGTGWSPGINRVDADTVGITNGTAGQYRDVKLRNLYAADSGTQVLSLYESSGYGGYVDTNYGHIYLRTPAGNSIVFGTVDGYTVGRVIVPNSSTGVGASIKLPTSMMVGWTGSNDGAAITAALAQNAARVVEINNGTAGQFGDAVCRSIGLGAAPIGSDGYISAVGNLTLYPASGVVVGWTSGEFYQLSSTEFLSASVGSWSLCHNTAGQSILFKTNSGAGRTTRMTIDQYGASTINAASGTPLTVAAGDLTTTTNISALSISGYLSGGLRSTISLAGNPLSFQNYVGGNQTIFYNRFAGVDTAVLTLASQGNFINVAAGYSPLTVQIAAATKFVIDSSGNAVLGAASVTNISGASPLLQIRGGIYPGLSLKTSAGGAQQWDLVNNVTSLGLYDATAGAYRLSIDTAGQFSFYDGSNCAFGTTTGTKFATATTQKMGWWNATPIVQPAAADQVALINSTAGTYDGTLEALPDPTDSPASADVLRDDLASILLPALRNNFTDLFTQLAAVRTALVNAGLMKGAA